MTKKDPPPFKVGKHYNDRTSIKIIRSVGYILVSPIGAVGLMVIILAMMAIASIIAIIAISAMPFLMPYIVFMEAWQPPGTEPRFCKTMFK